MARDYDDEKVRMAEKSPSTFADRVATLEAQVERISAMVAELGEHAAQVTRELGI